MRLVKENVILSTIYGTFFNYPAPINFTYFWNFGVYAFVCLAVQIVTGIFLAMHYTPSKFCVF